MNLVILGDIGVTDNIIHIGDEAMFEEFVFQAKHRGATRIVGISSAPLDTAARYSITGVQRIGFSRAACPTAASRTDRLDRILRTAVGETGLLGQTDPANGVIAAISGSDGAAISGGGNLSSIWPENIYERVAFGELARLFGVPLVVSGQTIGPVLFGDDVQLVSRLLGSARLVGLREPASFTLVSGFDLGDRSQSELRQGVDDASFLGLPDSDYGSQADVATPATQADQPYCLVTLAAHVGTLDDTGRTADGFTADDFIGAVAALLDDVVTLTDLDIRFLAHFGSADPTVSVGDTVVHEKVIARLTRGDARIVPTTDAQEAAALARGAALVVTSRYHPAVFAVSCGVPTIGIPVDDYTTDKLTGALGNFAQDAVLPAWELIAGRGTELLTTLWSERSQLRANGLAVSKANRAASTTWWNDVMVALAPRG